MDLTIDLPPEIETSLRAQHTELEREALEYLAVKWFTDGTLTNFQVGQLLGLGRWDTNALLKRHNVENPNPLTHEEIDADAADILAFLKERR